MEKDDVGGKDATEAGAEIFRIGGGEVTFKPRNRRLASYSSNLYVGLYLMGAKVTEYTRLNIFKISKLILSTVCILEYHLTLRATKYCQQ